MSGSKLPLSRWRGRAGAFRPGVGGLLSAGLMLVGLAAERDIVFPGQSWEEREPSALGLDPGALAGTLGKWQPVTLGVAAPDPVPPRESIVLFEDGFDGLRTGSLGSAVGAHAEYHYLPEVAPKGNWAVSTFVSSVPSQLAWRVAEHQGRPVLLQTTENKLAHTHPMVVGGDDHWANITLSVQFTPQTNRGRSGVAFRYRNDRCHYFFGVEDGHVVLKLVQHESAFHQPFETVLASRKFEGQPGDNLQAEVATAGDRIEARLNDQPPLLATDSTYPQGRIALVADGPTRFSSVRVTASPSEAARVAAARAGIEAEERQLQAANPKAVLWKKFSTDGFGVGRNLRFGDLDGDGVMDILIGQVLHHGPKDRNSEVSCLTAVTVDGRRLWQLGEPNPWNDHLNNDVAFQIHDLDGDGRNEVVAVMHMELMVLDGATGSVKNSLPSPATPANTPAPYNKFPRILGDSLFFCDLRGTGHPRDLIVKDRYRSFWAYNDRLELLWQAQCNTGHYPYAADLDGDGRDELAIGYSLFDDDGRQLWTLDGQLKDHADGVAVVRYRPEATEPTFMIAASDEGMLFIDPRGTILRHHRFGHVQNPSIADFRPDLPGLETITINFWGNQGIVHCFDAEGNLYHDFEPCQHGSMMLPVNWTGQPPEYWILSPNVQDGGMFDGWGRRVFQFPADGHPDLCVAVVDLTGDCRDELVVWNPHEVWIYTQDDNPKAGRLYKPRRNRLANSSNYQANVSLPGWSDDP